MNLRYLVFATIFCLTFSLVSGTVSHNAHQVTQGVFQDGNYSFPGVVSIGTLNTNAALTVSGNIIANSPIEDNHVATKAYVDAAGGSGSDLDSDGYLGIYDGAVQKESPSGYDCDDSNSGIISTIDGSRCDNDGDNQVSFKSMPGATVYNINSSFNDIVDCNDFDSNNKDRCLIQYPLKTLPNGDYYEIIAGTSGSTFEGAVNFQLRKYNSIGRLLWEKDFLGCYDYSSYGGCTPSPDLYSINSKGDLALLTPVDRYGDDSTNNRLYLYIVKANGAVEEQWIGSSDDYINDLELTVSDTGDFCTGYVKHYDGSSTDRVVGYINTDNKETYQACTGCGMGLEAVECHGNSIYMGGYQDHSDTNTQYDAFITSNSGGLIFERNDNSERIYVYSLELDYNSNNMFFIMRDRDKSPDERFLKLDLSTENLVWEKGNSSISYSSIPYYDGNNLNILEASSDKFHQLNGSSGDYLGYQLYNFSSQCNINTNDPYVVINGNIVNTGDECIFTGY